jgi:hypothetical protein
METIRVIENDRKIRDHITYYRIERLPAHPLYAESGMNLGGYICKDSKVEDGGWVSEGVFLTRSTVKDAAVLINSSVIGYKIDVIDSEISGSTSLNWEATNTGAIIKNSEISGLESGNTSLKFVSNSRVVGAWRCSNEYGIEIVESVIIGSGTVGGQLKGVWKN